MVKAVIDTNIWISGVIYKQKLAHLIDLWFKRKFVAYLSQETFLELQITLLDYAIKFDKQSEAFIFLNNVKKKAVFVTPQINLNLCEDPDDNKFLDVATEAKADYLVSGDKKLLKIKKVGKTKILSPREFLWLEIFSLGNKIGEKVKISEKNIQAEIKKLRKKSDISFKRR